MRTKATTWSAASVVGASLDVEGLSQNSRRTSARARRPRAPHRAPRRSATTAASGARRAPFSRHSAASTGTRSRTLVEGAGRAAGRSAERSPTTLADSLDACASRRAPPSTGRAARTPSEPRRSPPVRAPPDHERAGWPTACPRRCARSPSACSRSPRRAAASDGEAARPPRPRLHPRRDRGALREGVDERLAGGRRRAPPSPPRRRALRPPCAALGVADASTAADEATLRTSSGRSGGCARCQRPPTPRDCVRIGRRAAPVVQAAPAAAQLEEYQRTSATCCTPRASGARTRARLVQARRPSACSAAAAAAAGGGGGWSELADA